MATLRKPASLENPVSSSVARGAEFLPIRHLVVPWQPAAPTRVIQRHLHICQDAAMLANAQPSPGVSRSASAASSPKSVRRPGKEQTGQDPPIGAHSTAWRRPNPAHFAVQAAWRWDSRPGATTAGTSTRHQSKATQSGNATDAHAAVYAAAPATHERSGAFPVQHRHRWPAVSTAKTTTSERPIKRYTQLAARQSTRPRRLKIPNTSSQAERVESAFGQNESTITAALLLAPALLRRERSVVQRRAVARGRPRSLTRAGTAGPSWLVRR